MSIKILHTADVHLGMKFARYGDIQSELSETRYQTLEKLVSVANEKKCHLFVVAGDLFDRRGMAQKDIARTAQILSKFEGNLVLVLPGNHDFIISNDTELWEKFKSNAGDRVLLLDDAKEYLLTHYDIDACIYAAPCNTKKSSENRIGWIKEFQKDESIKYHIGIAHGSLGGVSPDFDESYFPMTENQLKECELDLWLLGHTDRLQYPEKPGKYDRIFFPGTPEPNDFNCHHGGLAWILELDVENYVNATSISAGTYRFISNEVALNNSSDVDKLKQKYISKGHKQTLLKLFVQGRLLREEIDAYREVIKQLESHMFYLEVDSSELSEKITKENIDNEFAEASFAHRLLTELTKDDQHPESIQIAYDLIKEMKNR